MYLLIVTYDYISGCGKPAVSKYIYDSLYFVFDALDRIEETILPLCNDIFYEIRYIENTTLIESSKLKV